MLELSTGAGKSLICAEIARIMTGLSGKKVLCLCPTAELVEQNHEKYLLTGNEASIYSASIGKSLRHDVVFATEGSFKSKALEVGEQYSTVILDECHRITAIGSPELYNRAARAVRSELETVQRNSDKSNQAAGGDYQQAEKPTIARDFAIETTVRYTAAIAAAFSEVGRTVEYRTADYQSLATPNTDRNREATRTIDQTGDRENSFSRAISTRVEGFDTNPIHQAIKRLEEQRQQIQVEKKQDYGRDYDSPSPF
jgi:maltooligosyltrehalose synthase